MFIMTDALPRWSEYVLTTHTIDRRSYLALYLDARGLCYEGGEDGKTPRGTCADLAKLAFGSVQASFRLSDIAQSSPGNAQRIAAQRAEVEGWDAKAGRYLARVPLESLYRQMVADFSRLATESRVPDNDELERIILAAQGRINDVVPGAPSTAYSWQHDGSGFDSAFNRAPSQR